MPRDGAAADPEDAGGLPGADDRLPVDGKTLGYLRTDEERLEARRAPGLPSFQEDLAGAGPRGSS